MKKIRVLIAIAAIMMAMAFPVNAQNVNSGELTGEKDVIVQTNDLLKASGYTIVMYYCPGGEKIANEGSIVPFGDDVAMIYDVKSSNKKVATAKAKKVNGRYRVHINVKRTGKVTITYKVKLNNGTSYQSSARYHYKKYKTPISSIKIGNKDLTKRYKKSIHLSGKPLKGKLKIKLKKGWKLVDYYTFNLKTYGSDDHSIKEFKTSKITIKKNERFVIRVKKGDITMNIMYDAK